MAADGILAAHEIIGHGRHERARQDERADQREDHRLGQRPEQIAGDAAELEHRHEHDAEAQQCHEGGYDDLLRAVEDRRFDRFALFEMVVDVFDRHGAVVDQDADGERQPAERHDVDGLAEPRQRGRARTGSPSGISMRMMTVERQLPRNSRIITPTSAAASAASRMTPNTAALTKIDWSPTALQIEARRQAFLDPRQQRFDARR